MAELTVQEEAPEGAPLLDIAYDVPTAGGDTFKNDGRTRPWVQNGDAVDATVRFVARSRCDQGFLDDAVYTVEAGEEHPLPALDPARFNQLGLATIVVTGVNLSLMGVAAVRMPTAR